MELKWTKPWDEQIKIARDIFAICENRIDVISPGQQQVSRDILQRVKPDLEGNEASIRNSSSNWSVPLANVAIRIAMNLRKDSMDERKVAKMLANYCGVVYAFKRQQDAKFERSFRESLQIFLISSLQDLVLKAIAADVIDEIHNWLKGVFDNQIPKDFDYLANDMIVRAFEARRIELDTPDTRGMMVRFVEENRDLISLPSSALTDQIREGWEKIYRDQVGEPTFKQEKSVLDSKTRDSLKKAILTTDPMAVRDFLAPLKGGLILKIKNMLDVAFEFNEPNKQVRDYSGAITADFSGARRQIRNGNTDAVGQFCEIWNQQVDNYYAMEWYAYALAKLNQGYRQAHDLFEQIRKADRGDELTDWNLACCEVKLGDRASAFRILRERVESGYDFHRVLEPAIFLAIENQDEPFLAKTLEWIPSEEAILLAYLCAADSRLGNDELEKRLAAIEAIASDSAKFEPPNPAERLGTSELNRLRFSFIRRRMIRGGITWFLRRLDFTDYRYNSINWRLLGDLYFQESLRDEGFNAYKEAIQCISSIRNEVIKKRVVEDILQILIDNQLLGRATEIIGEFGAMLNPAELERWRTSVRASDSSSIEQITVPTGGQKETVEIAPSQQNPQTKLMQVIIRLADIKRIQHLSGEFDLFYQGASSLYEIWPAYSRKLCELMQTTIQFLKDFVHSNSFEEKESLGEMLRKKIDELNSELNNFSQPELKQQAKILVSALGRLVNDASYQTKIIRCLGFEWRMNRYLPVKTVPPFVPDFPKTSIMLRAINLGMEEVSNIEIYLQCENKDVSIVENPQRAHTSLKPNEAIVLNFPLDYDSINGEGAFLVNARFTAGGIDNLKTAPTRFVIHTKSFAEQLSGKEFIQDNFFVGVGIPEERRDVFHGREREQLRIASSLRGRVQSEVLFLNGPRRVGKTSILNSLKWALPELGLNDVVPVSLGEEIHETTAAFLNSISLEIGKTIDRHMKASGYLTVPSLQDFQAEPISVFKRYCEQVNAKIAPRRILLMIDETQRLAEAMRNKRIDDNVLGLFSTLMSRDSGIMLIFTASVLFRNVKDMSAHPIWGRVTPFTTGFLNTDAVKQVLEAGVEGYPVEFTAEAINRIWQMTEGHPWMVQAIGKRIVNLILNPQRRLVVGPYDVDQVVEYIEKKEDQYSSYWWNENKNEGGFVDDEDWYIAKIIIENQEAQTIGVKKIDLFEKMRLLGREINNERINKLADMQTLVKEPRGGVEYIRIKGLFLERWLQDQVIIKFASSAKSTSNVALFIDHENVLISLNKFIEQLPTAKQIAWRSRLSNPDYLPRRLAQLAEKHGTIVPPRYAVANWQLFSKDIQAYAQAMFEISQPLGGKNTSDERLKQLIRDTLEQKSEVGVYIIATGDADFRDTIQTLLKRNKHVVLWGFRSIGMIKSNISETYREMESWQNLMIEYLDDTILLNYEGNNSRA